MLSKRLRTSDCHPLKAPLARALVNSTSAHRNAVVLLLVAALAWSLGGLLIKAVDWPALAVASARGWIAALFLVATHRGLRFHGSAPQLLGALGYAACTILFVLATKLTTAANAILLQYTAPVWVALFGAWLLGERATRIDWITIVIVLGGMGLFFGDAIELAHVAGNLVAIASGIAFAGMTIALRRQKDGSPVESIILGNVLAGLVGLPWLLQSPALEPIGWIALLTLGTVQLGLSYWLYARAIRHVTALEAVLIPVIEPILNPLWVLLVMGERPGPLAIVGGLVVLAAVTGRAVWALRQAPAIVAKA